MMRLLLAVVAALLIAATPAQAVSQVAAVPWGNDFSCHSERPRPVVLVHGLGATADTNWSFIGPRLRDAGYCVFALTYGIDPRTAFFGWPGGVIRMQQSAGELRDFVNRVRAATGAEAVDLVGHSEGTVMPRWYLERLGGAQHVRRFVALTPLWRGTELAGANLLRDWGAASGLSAPIIALIDSFCGSCPQFVAGSEYLNDLNADGEAIPGVEHTNIITRYDQLIIPYTSGIMRDGGTNIVIQDVDPANVSEHAAVAFDPLVAQLVLDALG